MIFSERVRPFFRRERESLDPFVQLIRIADGKAKFTDISPEEEESCREHCGKNPRAIHQLKAIEELGKSGRLEVLDYLRRIYRPKMRSAAWNDGDWDTYRDNYYYPNARGPLRSLLGYEDSPFRITRECRRAHQVVQAAILNLEDALGLPHSGKPSGGMNHP